MPDARRTGHEEEFFSINLSVDLMGRVTDVTEHCK